jgi:hypothetical protein
MFRTADKVIKTAAVFQLGLPALVPALPTLAAVGAGAFIVAQNSAVSVYVAAASSPVILDWATGVAWRFPAPGALFVATHLPGAIQDCFTSCPC